MYFSMNTQTPYSIGEKLAGIVNWVTQKRQQFVSTETPDTLYTEIYQLKKTLSNAPTRPTRAVRKSEPPEPVTEQQKIMDMAG
jgi:hypothetical protein